MGTYNSIYNMSYEEIAVSVVSFKIDEHEQIRDLYLLHSDGYLYDKEVTQSIKQTLPLLTHQTLNINTPYTVYLKFVFPFQYQ